MAKSIKASVGRMGVSFPIDVKVVQELLNRVPQNSGGPPVALQVDGACGPKTKDAIQKFQMRQFGFGGADGRVDPNGQTLAKLNELDSGLPSLPPPSPFPLTIRSVMFCSHGGEVSCRSARPFGPLSGGVPVLTPNDPCVVAGCPFPTPCVRVKWLSSPLDIRSIGTCFNAANGAQGPVVIAQA